MLRAADAVFSLEVATEGGPERLLQPLERIPDGAPRAAEAEPEIVDGDPPAAAETSTNAAPASASAATASASTADASSSPVAELPRDLLRDPPPAPSRDRSFVIVLAAIALGIAGVGALLALFLW